MFQLPDLDERTRKLMLLEIDSDVSDGIQYISERLSALGKQLYPGLLRDAAQSWDIAWLADQLRISGRMNATEQKRKPKSGVLTTTSVPVTAPDTLAEGEFNRFYARAVCRRAIDDGLPDVVVFRAKQVHRPRVGSGALLGTRLNAQALLDDLRANTGMDTALGLPPGPNSGLSVMIPVVLPLGGDADQS